VKDVECAVFQSVYSSQRNVLISVPLGFDKTHIVLLAVLNLLDAPANSVKCHEHRLKVNRTHAMWLRKNVCISENHREVHIAHKVPVCLLLSATHQSLKHSALSTLSVLRFSYILDHFSSRANVTTPLYCDVCQCQDILL
jgi:hypothetical protein